MYVRINFYMYTHIYIYNCLNHFPCVGCVTSPSFIWYNAGLYSFFLVLEGFYHPI